MPSIAENIAEIKSELPATTKLVAISKFHPASAIQEAYNAGQRIFGESRVQELTEKEISLPKDIEWHFIGHLQSNKVKYIAPFISLIHSVDSLKLLEEIDCQAKKNNRTINCLLEMHVAQEETKFGFNLQNVKKLIIEKEFEKFPNTNIVGIMGMASNTENTNLIKKEFHDLSSFFQEMKRDYMPQFTELSMGMSNDYHIAIEEGSTLVRIGTYIFGERVY